ncbi:cupin domain-containing protein [Tuwongella immobilis]|uniref:AraC-type arabinose-binding/dimerisation domain-containing protein n=1 Tax=Tuwongella immobilis TaxID=692036 RepID=A0A6C2YPU6_9BACT|nr:cupin domain-containing protein [Tuwongella immobilis]VIP03486.1 Uncharacterized protein OS=Legionella fallonii LLAP-10 GN=LFA_3272 PE=4 SV=1 [Tuwongella immobilis]VTS04342.1 Uncharacterized protein OS=Legionella fallonii LLAP-10 GN=LFA_3272 PE=4 SV=1 [Tuwongella immobilis]
MAIFEGYALRPGLLCSVIDGPHSVSLAAWEASDLFLAETHVTHYGYVIDGPANIRCDAGEFTLRAGMAFSIPGPCTISNGTGILISQRRIRGVFLITGPLESQGRLRYIDGCTDSLVIPPPLMGDPCLNLLHLPAGTNQSQHTHPSLRMGLILSGRGECITPEGTIPLEPNLAFVIHTDGMHSFRTHHEALRVLAFHPDSDFGPTHENHPMINRTILPDRAMMS